MDNNFEDTRGNKELSPDIKTVIFNTWIDCAIASTDGCNGRNMVNIKKRYLENYKIIINNNNVEVAETKNRRGTTIFSGNRMVATCSIKDMHGKLKEKDVDVSIGSVSRIRPCFITGEINGERTGTLYVFIMFKH